ncbi:hypothetical protein BE0216_03760 [Bifidobacterium eulemuris]|nr:hypothetical protein BE0216_03760 [Bifidobacterium eulemuris]
MQQQLHSQLVETYVAACRKMWLSLTPQDWWNDAVVMGAASRTAMLELQMVAAARRAGIEYADQTLRLIGQLPQGVVQQLVYPRVNTDPWLVAARPADSYRSEAVKNPSVRPDEWPSSDDAAYETVSEWIQAALGRIDATSSIDVQMAGTQATIDRYRGSKVLSYRRVLHPELSKSGSCGLCIVAADRWYSTANLMPLHVRCKCGVAPAGSDEDPGLDLNKADLDRLYAEAGSNKAEDLVNVRVKTISHGELGPVLTAAEARETDNPVPGVESKEWRTPDRATTVEQLQRMKNRAIEFSKHYKEVRDGGKEVSFRYEGRTYVFKPSSHLNQAWAYQRSMLNQVTALLDKAA